LVNRKPQVVINIVNASTLEHNLYLTCQFLELGVPIVIALNMMDVAGNRGIEIKAHRLASLLGVPVVPVIARTGRGRDDLLNAAVAMAGEQKGQPSPDISYGDDLDEALKSLMAEIARSSFLKDIYTPRFTALKYLQNDSQIMLKGREANPAVSARLESLVSQVSDHLVKTMDVFPEAIIADHRYGFIKSIIRQGVLTHTFDTGRLHSSDKIDKVVTNRLLGPVIMLAILFGLYQFTFSWSTLPVAWLQSLFTWFSGASLMSICMMVSSNPWSHRALLTGSEGSLVSYL
jgi:ferrous iron transport protein B